MHPGGAEVKVERHFIRIELHGALERLYSFVIFGVFERLYTFVQPNPPLGFLQNREQQEEAASSIASPHRVGCRRDWKVPGQRPDEPNPPWPRLVSFRWDSSHSTGS